MASPDLPPRPRRCLGRSSALLAFLPGSCSVQSCSIWAACTPAGSRIWSTCCNNFITPHRGWAPELLQQAIWAIHQLAPPGSLCCCYMRWPAAVQDPAGPNSCTPAGSPLSAKAACICVICKRMKCTTVSNRTLVTSPWINWPRTWE